MRDWQSLILVLHKALREIHLFLCVYIIFITGNSGKWCHCSFFLQPPLQGPVRGGFRPPAHWIVLFVAVRAVGQTSVIRTGLRARIYENM